MTACRMCGNASTDPELRSDNDLCYIGVGTFDKNRRMLFRTGDGRPTELLVEEWQVDQWRLIGYYRPLYCPNCGRRLIENEGKKEFNT